MESSNQKVFLNGEIIDQYKALISPFDMGFLFGASLYDVGPIYHGKLFNFNLHIDRIFRGLKKMNLKIPSMYTKEKFIEIAQKLIDFNKIDYGIIYLQISFGGIIGDRNKKALNEEFYENVKEKNKILKPTVFMFTKVSHFINLEESKKGCKAKTSLDQRWGKCFLKSSQLLENCITQNIAYKVGGVDTILYDENKIVKECCGASVFCVKDNIVYTHPIEEKKGGILPGITRKVTIQIAKDLKIELKEKKFTLDFLLNSDEVFFTATSDEVMPIVKVDDKIIKNGKPGKITMKLLKGFCDLVENKTNIKHPKQVLFK